MRSRRLDAHVANLEPGNLAHAEAAAAGEADEDQVEVGVAGARGFAFQVGEDRGQFAARQDLGAVDADRERVHVGAPR